MLYDYFRICQRTKNVLYQPVYSCRNITSIVGIEMTIGVQCNVSTCVPEAISNFYRCKTGIDKQAGMRMPQIMDPYLLDSLTIRNGMKIGQ